MYPVRAWVRIPDGLADDPDAFAEYIDYRLLVRLATAENQAPDPRRARDPAPSGLTRLPVPGRLPGRGAGRPNEIEQNGATAHAMIVNPYDWWYRVLGGGRILAEPGVERDADQPDPDDRARARAGRRLRGRRPGCWTAAGRRSGWASRRRARSPAGPAVVAEEGAASPAANPLLAVPVVDEGS